jgi:hypothetical protein
LGHLIVGGVGNYSFTTFDRDTLFFEISSRFFWGIVLILLTAGALK